MSAIVTTICRSAALTRGFAWLLLAVACWPLAAQARIEFGAPAAQAEATVGCMFPLAGRAAIYGRDSIAGMKLALADLEAAVGAGAGDNKTVRAPRLRVLVEDDRSKASFATRIAEDFIRRDRVRFLCGMVSSGVAQAVSRVARERRVIMVGTDHASSRLTLEEGHRYYFRVTNDIYASMAAGARYLAELQKQTGWRRLAFIGPDYEYGHVSWTDLQDSLNRLGVSYELVGEFWPRLYEPDYSAYLGKLADAKPDVVVTSLWGGDFIAFLKQALPAGLMHKARLANFDTGGNYDVLLSLGEQAPAGLILSARHHNNWPQTPRNQKFVGDFLRQEGRYPTYAAEGAYAGIIAIGRALAMAGHGASDEQLIRVLEGMHLSLPEDPPGEVSRIDPDTHQIVQAQAIGEVVPNTAYPPARVMLGNWRVYRAEDLQPPLDLQRQRRARPLAANVVPQSNPRRSSP